ncbi:MAG TPA: DUF4296 domain-containing protein [Chitinophagaceae bacterium]
MKWNFALLAGFFFLFSCKTDDRIPKGIIGMRSMQLVTWDVMLADELALQRKFADSSIQLKNATSHLYDTVFAIHGITRDQFYSSYRFYQNHPELYRKLMTGVKKIGEAEKKSLQPPSVQ